MNKKIITIILALISLVGQLCTFRPGLRPSHGQRATILELDTAAIAPDVASGMAALLTEEHDRKYYTTTFFTKHLFGESGLLNSLMRLGYNIEALASPRERIEL